MQPTDRAAVLESLALRGLVVDARCAHSGIPFRFAQGESYLGWCEPHGREFADFAATTFAAFGVGEGWVALPRHDEIWSEPDDPPHPLRALGVDEGIVGALLLSAVEHAQLAEVAAWHAAGWSPNHDLLLIPPSCSFFLHIDHERMVYAVFSADSARQEARQNLARCGIELHLE